MFPSAPDVVRPASDAPLAPPASAPAPCGVPPFGPLRVRGGGALRLRRAMRKQRRATAAGLALTAAALAASGLGGSQGTAAGAGSDPPAEQERRSVRLVSAPVRIADAETVRLLRPGDRVDVIAADDTGSVARVVAKDVRVAEVPRGTDESGALVVLSAERATAAALAGAGMSSRLAVAVTHAR
jgi:hypothetical protein